MDFPFLSVIVLTPLTAGLIMLLQPAEKKERVRWIGAIAGFFVMALSLYVYFAYDRSGETWQFVEEYSWVPSLGISWKVGADGVNLPMLALTGVVLFCGALVSWGIDDRPREFYAFLFILTTGVLGVFAALDLFMLFFAYELAVFPMYLLIVIWGWKVTREYAAMKLTLYLLVGSIIALIGLLAMYFKAGMHTFDMLRLTEAGFPADFQRLFFLPVFLGFGVLAAIWPFHTWSPDGHVAAPTAVSMLHAGVLMKVGAYSALRVGIMLLPEGAKQWLPWVVILTTVNVVYGASVAMVQKDFKYVIGYSSVSHMGLVSMGFAAMNLTAMTGSGVQMFSHGIMTALFFAIVGIVYDRAHTRHLPDLGGFVRKLPWVTVAFVVGGLVSMGMPGLSGFIAEFQILTGVWDAYPVAAALCVLGIVFTAAYVLRVTGAVFFGDLKPEYEDLPGSTVRDKIALFILCAVLIIVGVFPSIMVDLVRSGMEPIVQLLGG
ncbi:MAG: complex I subunit 4 family protein [Chloroflexota bacterium]